MWKDDIFQSLDAQRLFQDEAHRSRFKELLDCYANAPFVTPGLCKCMYMSCWDDEHFFIMLDMLNQLTLRHNTGLDDMYENGELMAEESEVAGSYEDQVMRLSCAFLMDKPFSMDDLPADYNATGRKIISESLKAAAIIDAISEDK